MLNLKLILYKSKLTLYATFLYKTANKCSKINGLLRNEKVSSVSFPDMATETTKHFYIALLYIRKNYA